MEQMFKFKKGTMSVNGINCVKIKDFAMCVDNNLNTVKYDFTTRSYTFSINLKFIVMDKIKRFFGIKTKLERFLGDKDGY